MPHNDNFSLSAKEEISTASLFSRRAKIAMLSAIIHTAGSIVVRGGMMMTSAEHLSLVFEGLNSITISVLTKLLSDLHNANDLTKEGKTLIIEGTFFDKLMDECGIFKKNQNGERDVIPGIEPSLLKGEGAEPAYIRGMFLGSGSISLKKGYHLEFVVSNTELAEDLIALLERHSIFAKYASVKRGFKVYLKGRQAVSDCLALLGASKSVMQLNDKFANRMVSQLVNRRLNCDLANIDKTVDTANRQLEAIKTLKSNERFGLLEPKLKEAAEARLNNPESTLAELALILKISKSGIRHRLDKLVALVYNENE